MDDPSLSQFCCQNPRCVAYGARATKIAEIHPKTLLPL